MAGEIGPDRPDGGAVGSPGVQLGSVRPAVGMDAGCSAQDHSVDVDGVNIFIRTYRPNDAPAVRELYATVLRAGGAVPPVVPDDPNQPEEAFGEAQGYRVWVAEDRRQLVGVVGFLKESAHVGRLRPLRIAPCFRAGTLPAQLVRTVLQHGREAGVLKIIFDADVQEHEAVRIFSHCGYRFVTQRRRNGRFQIEFYLDLYGCAPCEGAASTTLHPGTDTRIAAEQSAT